MNNQELQNLQARINFDGPSMAACLGLDYEQYRRYYYGHTAIPERIERAARELEQVNLQFMASAVSRIDGRIEREFPHGIMSEVPCD